MKIILLALSLSLAATAETIEAFGLKWDVPVASEWSFENGVLKMLRARPQENKPRRPVQFALAQTDPYGELEIAVDVKRHVKSMIIVYAWQKEGYFDYAHLSVDLPSKQPVHNGIFHCYGGDRVRISSLEGANALPTEDWTPVKLVYSANTGKVQVWVAGKALPSLLAVDMSLGAGRFGLGSFFETGAFRNLKFTSIPSIKK